MRQLPTGTVTFLFTDIEGSTRLLHELGERYADVLVEHRRVLREAFERHGGAEVDTQGDAFFVAFHRASDALAAAAEAQRALAAGPVRVRMGVHTGEPVVTSEGYVGVDVHKGARIAAAGHGGQVLVSEQTARLIQPSNSLLLTDLGAHRLKDLTAPERLYQLGEREFPPLRTLNQTNLPVQPTPFLGRERELAELVELVQRDEVRLLTLTGPGGTGKTRLALQAAAELADAFADGVFLVTLAPVSDPELVLPTIAQTLGVREQAAERLTETLKRELAEKQLLLLLDNFEQVEAAASLVADLLASVRRLKVVATSRAPLHIAAEHEYAVSPL
jgi:class 3 adenylate cyclase